VVKTPLFQLALVLVALGLLVWWLLGERRDGSRLAPDAGGIERTPAAPELVAAREPNEPSTRGPLAPEPDRLDLAPAPDEQEPRPIRGRVLDARTLAPITGSLASSVTTPVSTACLQRRSVTRAAGSRSRISTDDTPPATRRPVGLST